MAPGLPGAQGPSLALTPALHSRGLHPVPLLLRPPSSLGGLQPQGPHREVKAEALQAARSGPTPAHGPSMNLPPFLHTFLTLMWLVPLFTSPQRHWGWPGPGLPSHHPIQLLPDRGWLHRSTKGVTRG